MMRKLSELVKFRNSLIIRSSSISSDESIHNTIKQLQLTISENFEVDKFSAHDKINHIIVEYKKIITELSIIDNLITTIITDIDEKIDQVYTELDFKIDINQGIFFQKFILDQHISQIILSKVEKYGSLSYPGLRLGCRYIGNFEDTTPQDDNLSGLFSNHMVSNDPLYFCDISDELITDVTQHFNTIYINRIRKYVIPDSNLSALPQKQFGFILSWWFFNFADLLTVENYLKSIFNLLRPGGVLMFSYNNSDLFESARLVDLKLMSHIPCRRLTKLCQEIGFEIIGCYDKENTDPLIQNISWMEIKKPGTLSSVKLAQVLGRISTK